MFTALRAAPARIDLSPGVPDLTAFPRADWLHAERTVLGRLTPDAFGYGDPAGAPEFRRAVAGWLARYRGITADPADIVVVAGVAQALALLCRVLHRRGLATVGVEDPGSLGARQQLQHWGATTVGVAVDDSGLRVDALRATGAPVVLVSPAHQFPMGVVLDGARRRELIDWAAGGGLVIEDDYDAEHRYDRPPVTALQAGRPDRVCYAGSVSKILAPALRIGWLIPPRWLLDDVVAAKQEADLGNPVLAQLVLAELMESGRLERHLRAVRRRHQRRRDAMIAALDRYLPGATVHGTAAGLHLTVTLDDPPNGPGRRRTARPWTTPPWTTPRWPGPRWPPGSRCSRCPGTGSAQGPPGWCWATPPARPARSTRAWPSSVTCSGGSTAGRHAAARPGRHRDPPGRGRDLRYVDSSRRVVHIGRFRPARAAFPMVRSSH